MEKFRNLGKKIFFLYPPSVFEEQMMDIIVQAEFETYILKDHSKLHSLLLQNPHSILYINIDSTLKEAEWEKLIRGIQANDQIQDLIMGVVTYNDNKDLAAKYLMDIGLSGGFVILKLGLRESIKIILTTLNAAEARGERKHVRTKCSSVKASFNCFYRGSKYEGTIEDISAGGMAGFFQGNIDFPAGTEIQDVQLNLKGKLVKAPLSVLGSREIGIQRLYIFQYQENMEAGERNKIRGFVHQTLQQELDRLIPTLP